MAQANGSEAGSLKIEKLLWTYDDLAAATGLAVITLRRYVSTRKLRHPAVLKFGKRAVRFNPREAMARIQEIGAEHVQR